jgi:hypothetical protein
MLPMIATLDQVIDTYGHLIAADSMEEESEESNELISRQESEEEHYQHMDVQSNEQASPDVHRPQDNDGIASNHDDDLSSLPTDIYASRLCGESVNRS